MLVQPTISSSASANVQILNGHCDNHRQLAIKLSAIDDVTRLLCWVLRGLKGGDKGWNTASPFAIRVRTQLPISSLACYMQI